MKAKMLLLCFGGFSTSLLIKRLQKHLLPYGIELEADAEPIEKGLKIVGKYDIVLIAPQVKHMAATLQKEADKFNIPVVPIPMNQYAVENPTVLIQQIVGALKKEGE